MYDASREDVLFEKRNYYGTLRRRALTKKAVLFGMNSRAHLHFAIACIHRNAVTFSSYKKGFQFLFKIIPQANWCLEI